MFFLPFLLALATAQGPDDPRVIVRQATLAVEGDSVARFRARWDARVGRDRNDRAAELALATLARLTYDYPTADRLYKEIVRADSTKADRLAAYARLGFAQSLQTRGFAAEARPQFERAQADARATGDRILEGEVLLYLAVIRSRTVGLDAEVAIFDTAAMLYGDTARSLEAQRLWRLAIVEELRGRPVEARAAAERSVVLARAANDLRTEADGHRALGQALVHRGRLDSALLALKLADSVYRRARCGCSRSGALIWQAQAYGGLARLGEMREAIRAAMAEGEATHNPSALASAYRGYATISNILGDVPTALTYVRKATAVSTEIGDSTGARMARSLQSGLLLSLGQLREARDLALRQVNETRISDPGLHFAALRELATIAGAEKDWNTAASYIEQARALLPVLPGPTYRSWLIHDEGRIALDRGDLDAAERAFLSYLSVASDSASDVLRYDVRMRMSDIYARRGDATRAERDMTEASNDMDAWRARLTDAELRTLAFQVSATNMAAAAEATERDARVARIIDALAKNGRVGGALELAERRRARELRDGLARADALRACPVEGCASTLSKALPEPRTASELAALIPEDAAILEFVGGSSGAPTTAFLLQRQRTVGLKIATGDSLRERIGRLATLLESGANVDALARQLGSALLDSAFAALGPRVHTIVIVADGALHNLPWDALRVRGDSLAVQRYALTVAPSATMIATAWRGEAGRSGNRTQQARLLAFGDPETARTFSDGAAGTSLPRLRASALEARLVARYAADSNVRLRAAASADYLLQTELDTYQIVHFATHAVVDETDAARSALILSPGKSSSGLVSPGDLAALHLNADLVVLSACRSARGVVVGGEGVQGLTAPLLQAGARSVLATQWRIDDRNTVQFVEDFYGALAKGANVADALRSARLQAIERGTPASTWAAFTLVGDPLVTIALQIPAPEMRWSRLLIPSIVIIAAAFFSYRRRRRSI